MMIVKIQRPLATSGTEPKVLIYNEDRSVEMYLPYNERLFKAVFGSDPKQYWEAELGEQPGGVHYYSEVTFYNRVLAELDW